MARRSNKRINSKRVRKGTNTGKISYKKSIKKTYRSKRRSNKKKRVNRKKRRSFKRMRGGATEPKTDYTILYASEDMHSEEYKHNETEIELIEQFADKCVDFVPDAPPLNTIKINFELKDSTGGTTETLILKLNEELKNITFNKLKDMIDKVVSHYNKILKTETRTFFGYFGNKNFKKYAMDQNLSELETDKINRLKYT